ncbi:hypothetical protein GGR51DRAFT_568293 [Nemania sp. FL0031]|nr:hypothetical protein GGR51DRAFT_568293 [Nemania sp. FL0031]
MNWPSLPEIVRTTILNSVAAILKKYNFRSSSYATVSKEWQSFFEKRHFGRLVLHQSCIPEFDTIVRHQRRDIVRHIWLRIQVAPYENNDSFDLVKRMVFLRERDDETITTAIRYMLYVLSSWPEKSKGPILELSIHSPYNLKYFPSSYGYHLDFDFYTHATNENCTDEEFRATIPQQREKHRKIANSYYLREHDYLPQELSKAESMGMDIDTLGIEHVQFTGLDIKLLGEGFRSAPVVRGLLIRRQYFTFFSGQVLSAIFESLPKVESLRLEPWYPGSEYHPDRGHEIVFMLGLAKKPTSFKTLSVFQSHNPGIRRPIESTINLGLALADETSLLEHVSISFLIDSEHFFNDFKPRNPSDPWNTSRSSVRGWLISQLSPERRQRLMKKRLDETSSMFGHLLCEELKAEHGSTLIPSYRPSWPHLKSLALTSGTLDCGSSAIAALLLVAAWAAMEMPQLQTMEIWNAYRGNGCIFRYSRTGSNGGPKITLISSWGFSLTPQVVNNWNHVACKHADREVVIEELMMRGEEITSHATVIDHLELRQLVCHQISLCEMRYEASSDKIKGTELN